MESLKSDKHNFKNITYPVSIQKNRSSVAAVRTENSILEMPKLVPVSDPKPPMESSQQQSVLKKSVTTSSTPGGAQKVIKLIKTVHGPNGNPINKIVSLKIKESSSSTSQSPVPLSLVPITLPKETQPAMLKISGVTPVPFRKIVPKDMATNQKTIKPNISKELSHHLKLTKDVIMTSKQHTVLVKQPSQEPQKRRTQPKEPFSGFQLPSNITCSLSTGTSEAISTLVSSKMLEIKTISMMDPSKPLTVSSVAAPAPITTETMSTKANIIDSDLVATIEKTTVTKKMPLSNYELTKKDNGNGALFKHPTAANKMINLQISNGKLSDPNGPIKLISATTASKPETRPIETTWTDSALDDRQETLTERSKVKLIDIEPLSLNLETLTQSENLSENHSEPSTPSPPKEKNSDDDILTQRKPIKQKQQSLLRNKTIDLLQRSPRTKGRSKSLTALHKRLNRKMRRLSVSSEGDAKKTHTRKSSSISPPTKTPSEVQVNKLLCPEKMSASNDSIASSPPVVEKVTSVPAKKSSIEIIVMNSSDDEEVKSISPEPTKVTDNEVYNYLHWEDGVGCLKESNLQFHLNEFGLIEIIKAEPLQAETDPNKEKPIFEREFKSQKTLDYMNPYFCKGCNCKGASVDFLTSDFCSTACFKRFNGRKSNGTDTLACIKKYTNRKRRPDELEMDPLEVKSVETKSSNVFQRDTHLAACKAESTPLDLFLNPFPCTANMFSVGMKLESIDPEHSSLFCVCTIVEKKGYRLKLHFDGYPKFYDFWVNADSMDIFPPGWCAKTNRTLQPPLGMTALAFNWPEYLTHTKALPAPRNLFAHLKNSSKKHGFWVGMKIEADDLRNSGKVCVATVADILGNRLLIVFDGWDDSYSYWIDVNSPFIHPVNWHKKHGFSIVAPPDYEDAFAWPSYLAHTKSIPATENLFNTRDPIDFKPGMKLEVVDKRNPSLIRPASVIMTDDYEIKVLFENWPAEYAFWMEDDSADLHPVGWCEITNHELEPPPGYDSSTSRYCQFPGCRGKGHALNRELNVHANIMSCPYAPTNWSMDIDRSGRLRSCKKFINSILPANIKPKEIIHRNKRKADPLMRAPIIAKQPKPQIEAQMENSLLPIPPPAVTTSSGVSLLANKIEESDTDVDTRINIARHLLCDYGPRLQQVYSLWKQNSECLVVNLSENKEYKKNPLEWNVNEVAEYVAKLPRCQTLAQEFEKQDIDGSAFLSMRQSDLTEVLKIKLGPAIKIYNQIVQLREDVATRFINSTSRIC